MLLFRSNFPQLYFTWVVKLIQTCLFDTEQRKPAEIYTLNPNELAT